MPALAGTCQHGARLLSRSRRRSSPIGGSEKKQGAQFEQPHGIAASGSALVVSSFHRVTLFALGAAEEKDNDRQEP